MSKGKIALVITLSVLVLAAGGFLAYTKYSGNSVFDASADTPTGSGFNAKVLEINSVSPEPVATGSSVEYGITVNYDEFWKVVLGNAQPTKEKITAWQAAHPNDRYYLRGWLADGLDSTTGKWLFDLPNYEVQLTYSTVTNKTADYVTYHGKATAPEYNALKDRKIYNIARIARCDAGKNCSTTKLNKIAEAVDTQIIAYNKTGANLTVYRGDVHGVGPQKILPGSHQVTPIVIKGSNNGKSSVVSNVNLKISMTMFTTPITLLSLTTKKDGKNVPVDMGTAHFEPGGQTINYYNVPVGDVMEKELFLEVRGPTIYDVNTTTSANRTIKVEVSSPSVDPNLEKSSANLEYLLYS